jgi:3-oxoacyl-[acyl-carrier protein] reductase
VNSANNLSRLVAEQNIRVNCLAPGNIRFPGGNWERHLENRRAQVEHYIATEVPQKRFGTPEEIAHFAAYLVSPLAAFATGACYVMDGGQIRST